MTSTRTLTLYTRMVNSKAKPVGISINGCQIVDIQIDWHRSHIFIDARFSAKHYGLTSFRCALFALQSQSCPSQATYQTFFFR